VNPEVNVFCHTSGDADRLEWFTERLIEQPRSFKLPTNFEQMMPQNCGAS